MEAGLHSADGFAAYQVKNQDNNKGRAMRPLLFVLRALFSRDLRFF